MFSKIFFATLLATPLVSACGGAAEAFGLISIQSGSRLQAQSINAVDGHLWIGKNTSSYCPLKSGCPAGNITTFTAGNQTLHMNVEVPGGQQVYINTTAAISFTAPHSAETFDGLTTGWNYTAGEGSSLGRLTFPGYGFIACASTDGPDMYQVYATPGGVGTGNCTSIAINTVPYHGNVTAWEYA
ncbi:hypothetical protein NHQ30_011650 [Ciborinia camelliae]|nr:hypothetical protein NHQ30_011650 [Ciborinia camelliae]